jgi:hypothetical protein
LVRGGKAEHPGAAGRQLWEATMNERTDSPTANAVLVDWVDRMQALCKPDRVGLVRRLAGRI